MTIDIYGRIVPASDELYHFGIKGMHWGIRRFQPYPNGHTGGKYVGEQTRREAKGYQRELNNLDIGRAHLTNDNRRLKKQIAKGKSYHKNEFYLNEERLRKIKKQVDRVLKECTKKGYILSTRSKNRDVLFEHINKGRQLADTFVYGGIIPQLLLRPAYPKGGIEEGTRYKVRVNKKRRR